MADSELSIIIEPKKLARLLAAAAFVLYALGFIGQVVKFGLGHPYVYGLVPLFDLDESESVPNYFSVLLLLGAAAALAAVARQKMRQRAPYFRHWALLPLVFVSFSMDEMIEIHDLLSKPVRELVGADEISFYYWVLPATPLVLIFGAAYVKFLVHLPPTTRRLFSLSAAIYVGGALVGEIIGGWYAERFGVNWLFSILAMTEEALEMTGMILFIYSLLDYARGVVPEVRLRLGG